MRNISKKIISVIVLSLIFIQLFSASVSADGNRVRSLIAENKTVVIRSDKDYGYFFKSGDSYTGYYVDYLEEIAKYNNWEYTYIVCGSDAEYKKTIKNDEYDFVIGVDYDDLKSDSEITGTLFPVGTRSYSLCVKKDNPYITLEDYQSIQGIKVGVGNNDKELEGLFKSFLDRNGIAYSGGDKNSDNEISFINLGGADIFKSLDENVVDGILCSNSDAYINNLFAAVTFASEPVYCAVKGNNIEDISKFNQAQTKIKYTNSDFEDKLYDSYFSPIYKANLSFTEDEISFLEKNRVYNVGFCDGKAPYSYAEKNGEAEGISVEVFEKIKEYTAGRIRFNYIVYDSYEELEEAIFKGYCDISGMSVGNVKNDGTVLYQSKSYYEDKYYLFENKNNKNASNAKVVLPEGVPKEICTIAGVHEDSIIWVPSTQEALEYVNQSEADMTITLYEIGTYYINRNSFVNVSGKSILNKPTTVTAGYSENISDTAKGIFDKCITYMGTEYFQDYVFNTQILQAKRLSLAGVIYENKLVFIIILVIFTALIVCFVVFIIKYLIMKTNSNKTKKLLKSMSGYYTNQLRELDIINTMATMPSEKSDDIEYQKNCLKRNKNIIDEMLEFSQDLSDLYQIYDKSMTVDKSEFDLYKLIGQIDTMYQLSASDVGMTLVTHISRDVPNRVVGDEQKLRRILEKLISNAIRFNKKGEDINFSVFIPEDEGKNGCKIRFLVSDRGCGILPENIDDVFNAFVREDRNLNGLSSYGMGIGLTVSQMFANLMGSRIMVQSQPGEGSRFWFDVEFGQDSAAKTDTLTDDSSYLVENDLSGCRYLVAEDSEISAEIIQYLLESAGAKVDIAADGEDALKTYKKSPEHFYSGVIINTSLSDMSGMDAASKIRQLSRRDSDEVIIIGLSQSALSDEFSKAEQSGMDFCFKKPVDNTELIKVLFDDKNNKK